MALQSWIIVESIVESFEGGLRELRDEALIDC